MTNQNNQIENVSNLYEELTSFAVLHEETTIIEAELNVCQMACFVHPPLDVRA